MSHPTTYKPSPLSFGSPRTSPFRRPDSPSSPLRHADSPSSTIRPSTPTKSLSTPTIPQTSPSKVFETTTTTPKPSTPNDSPWTPRGLPPPATTRPIPPSPTRTSSAITAIQSTTTPFTHPNNIPPPLLSALHQTFSLLDHTSSNLITPSSLSLTLTHLSLPTNPSSLSTFFPPNHPQQLSLPAFLSTFSSLLAPLSSERELLNAFAAFDERDSGEIDVGELRDAVMQTVPEEGGRVLGGREVDEVLAGFVGRRAFGKGNLTGGRGEVFRYREWVGGVMGVGEEGKKDEGGK